MFTRRIPAFERILQRRGYANIMATRHFQRPSWQNARGGVLPAETGVSRAETLSRSCTLQLTAYTPFPVRVFGGLDP